MNLAVSSVEEEVTISNVEVLLFVSVAPVGKTIFVSLVDIAEVVVALEKSVSKAAVGEVVSTAEEEMVVSNAVVVEVVTKAWVGLLTVEFTQIIVWRMGMYEELS